MQTLFNTWWFGEVLFPVATSIVTGVWTGLAVTRYLMFYQETQRARERVMTIVDKVGKMILIRDQAEAAKQVLWLILEPTMALWAQGHWKAGWHIKELSLRMQDEAMKLHADFFRSLPTVPRDRQEEFIKDALEDGHRIMQKGLRDLGRASPDLVTVLFGVALSRKIYRTRLVIAAWQEHMDTGEPFAAIRARQKKDEASP